MILMLILNEILVWYSFRRFITDAAGAQKLLNAPGGKKKKFGSKFFNFRFLMASKMAIFTGF